MNANTPSRPESAGRLDLAHYELEVSTYDRAASLLLALLILVGITVIGLLIVFFTSRIFARPRAVPVTLARVAGEGGGPALDMSRQLEPPGVDEFPDVIEPQLQQKLTAVENALSENLALLDEQALEAEVLAGTGTGKGDSRRPGDVGDGVVEKVPRAERWEIRFEASSLASYARQLDYFGIELATLGSDNQVHYAFNLSQPAPQRRTGDPASEERMYMIWRRGPLMAADRELLKRAGIAVPGQNLLQFYPLETEQRLASLEMQAAGDRSVNDIRKTVFGVQQQGDQFEFHVTDQKYF